MAGVESTLVNSIVGAGTFFKGQIDVSGLLRIDGDLSGSVKTTGRVIIGRTGRVDCTVDAASVVVGGVFRGSIYASEKVIALETAIIIGNIFTPRLIAESGVYLDGSMHIRGVLEENDSESTQTGQAVTTHGRDGTGSIPKTRRRGRRGRRRVPSGNL
jgi:cytoskeletal protein CcmA (bactofilin family)